jgi:hypothetical protein
MYADRLWSHYQAGQVAGFPETVTMDWVLDPQAQHCSVCPENALGGPYAKSDLPSIPGDGNTPCLTLCRCRLVVHGSREVPWAMTSKQRAKKVLGVKKVVGVQWLTKQQKPPQKWVTVQGKRIPITQAGPQQPGAQAAPAPVATPEPPPVAPEEPKAPRKIGVVKAPSLEAAKAAVKKLTRLLDPPLESKEQEWEPREETKKRIAKNLAKRLEGNEAWEAFVSGPQTSFRTRIFIAALREAGGEPQSDAVTYCGGIVSMWAGSSGDSLSGAIAMQMAVREEFGLADAEVSHLGREIPGQLESAQEMYATDRPAMRAFARAMYDETQAWLSANGLDAVPLFRGAGVPKDFAKSGEVAEVQLQPMSSFSANPETAAKFAYAGYSEHESAALLYAAVPRELILATCQTGYGCRDETELVVLGGRASVLNVGTAEYLLNPPTLPYGEWDAIADYAVEQGGPENAQP